MLNVEGMGATEHDKHYNQYPCKSILENLDQTINKKYVNNIPFEIPNIKAWNENYSTMNKSPNPNTKK